MEVLHSFRKKKKKKSFEVRIISLISTCLQNVNSNKSNWKEKFLSSLSSLLFGKENMPEYIAPKGKDVFSWGQIHAINY